jgi:hypothetical protein
VPGNPPGAAAGHQQTEEALNVRKGLVVAFTLAFILLGVVAPLYAQEAGARAGGSEVAKWSIITAGFALAIAAAFGASASRGPERRRRGDRAQPEREQRHFASRLSWAGADRVAVIYVLLIC